MQLLSPTQASGYTKHPLRNALFVLRYLRHRGPRFSSSSEFLTARTLHQLTMTKKESRGSFEGKITKEPRPSFICNYMISHLGIKFKVNVYIYGQKVSTNFDSFKNLKDICTLAVGGDFARYAFRSQGFICKKLDNYAQSNIFLPQTPKR